MILLDEILYPIIKNIPAHPSLTFWAHPQRPKELAIVLICPGVGIIAHPGEIFQRRVHITFHQVHYVLIEIGVTALLKVPGFLL